MDSEVADTNRYAGELVSRALAVLPYVPTAHTDELLSSWIERPGHFYGIGYLGARVILEPCSAGNKWAAIEDVDASDSMRTAAVRWSGLPQQFIPTVISSADDTLLGVSARLTYCAECWYEDVERGWSPYIRKKWINWQQVVCPVHNCWLNAREPHIGNGYELNGWAPVWQSNANWARTAFVSYDPTLHSSALGFDCSSIAGPDCSWTVLFADFEFLADDCYLLRKLVSKPEHRDIYDQVFQALEIGPPNPRITDAHLRGYDRSAPGWIATRIGCLVTGVEILRILHDRKPAFEIAKRTIERLPSARRVIDEFNSAVVS